MTCDESIFDHVIDSNIDSQHNIQLAPLCEVNNRKCWSLTCDLTWPRTFPKWCNLLKLKANSSRHREKRTPVKFLHFQTFRFITLYCIQIDIWFSIPLVLSHCVVLYLCWCFDLQCSIYVFVTLYYIPIILCLVRKVWNAKGIIRNC